MNKIQPLDQVSSIVASALNHTAKVRVTGALALGFDVVGRLRDDAVLHYLMPAHRNRVVDGQGNSTESWMPPISKKGYSPEEQ